MRPSRRHLQERIEELEITNCDLKSACARRNFAYEVVRNSMRKASLRDENYCIPKRTFHRWQNVLTNAGMDDPDKELDAAMVGAGAPYVLEEENTVFTPDSVKTLSIRKFGGVWAGFAKVGLASLLCAVPAEIAGWGI